MNPAPQRERMCWKDSKREVTYEECRKNHAASIGKYAVDGCCEFMPSGEEGSGAALRCAACSCHRNFHKRSCATSVTVAAIASRQLITQNSQSSHGGAMAVADQTQINL